MKRVLLGICIVSGLYFYNNAEVIEELQQINNVKGNYKETYKEGFKQVRHKDNPAVTRGSLENHISKKKTPLERFNYLHSKIIRSDADNEILEKETLNKNTHESARKTLLYIEENGFSGKTMVEREIALSFISLALEKNPNEGFILNEIEDIVVRSLSTKYDRRTQKSINADVLDLLSILDEFNPEFARQMIQNDQRVLNYFEYMKALKKSMGEQS